MKMLFKPLSHYNTITLYYILLYMEYKYLQKIFFADYIQVSHLQNDNTVEEDESEHHDTTQDSMQDQSKASTHQDGVSLQVVKARQLLYT